jgi:uncharacterized protein YdaU (DUF1376 family)
MHYYNFNIGDYMKHTLHLTLEEDLAYRRLLDMYYDTESPIPNNIPSVSRRLRMDSKIVESVLNEFFEVSPEGYKNYRADGEIADYHKFLEKQKANGRLGGRPKKGKKPIANPDLTQSEPKKSLNNKQQTTNNIGAAKATKGTRFDLISMPEDWVLFCKKERSDLNPTVVFDGFRDYWVSVPGQKGVKLDWTATWRNWIRNQKGGEVKQVGNFNEMMRMAK